MQYLASTCMIHASTCKLVSQCLNECEEDVIETQAQHHKQYYNELMYNNFLVNQWLQSCVALQEFGSAGNAKPSIRYEYSQLIPGGKSGKMAALLLISNFKTLKHSNRGMYIIHATLI